MTLTLTAMARHDGKGASRGLSPLFLGKAKSAMCESCLQERDQWLIGKRPHFGPQIFTERGAEKRNLFGGRHDWCNTELGVQKRPPFFQNRCAPGRRQLGHCRGKKATAAWQWFNWTLQRVPLGKTPLRLNFDETSCRLFYETAPGIFGKRAHRLFSSQRFHHPAGDEKTKAWHIVLPGAFVRRPYNPASATSNHCRQ